MKPPGAPPGDGRREGSSRSSRGPGEIARRKGKAARRRIRSDWDMYLGCESRRLASTTRAEIADLIRHARGLNGEDKGERDDYIDKTVNAVFLAEPTVHQEEEPRLEEADSGARAPSSAPGSRANGTSRREIASGHASARRRRDRPGSPSTTGANCASAGWATSSTRPSTPGASRSSPAARCPSLSKDQALLIAQLMIRVVRRRARPRRRQRQETIRGWLGGFIATLGKFYPGELRTPAGERWEALLAVRTAAPTPLGPSASGSPGHRRHRGRQRAAVAPGRRVDARTFATSGADGWTGGRSARG